MIGVIISTAPFCGAESGEAKTLSPYFFIENGDALAEAFPLKKTDVRVQINGVIADVVVSQTYANEGSTPINARYIFPASTRAAVQGMTMTIGDSVIHAKIKEKEVAKKEFDAAKKSGKSASLLSQQRPNVFSMNVANIMPGDTVYIDLHYSELLIPEEGVYEFMYPTVVGPRYSSQAKEGALESDTWIENPYLKMGMSVKTTFNITTDLSTGMPLHDLACSSHDTAIIFDSSSVSHVTLKDKETFSGNRDYILHYRLADKKIQSGLMLYSGHDENFFLLTVQPPKQISPRDIPPREYIFLVDVSGSMHGFPLDVSKELLKNLIGSLRQNDVFNVILFAGASQAMAPVSLSATNENINKAIQTINRQQGGGGTALLAALQHAIALPRNTAYSRSVIVVTDGYIDTEKKVFDAIHQNLSQTNFFAFGIGGSVNRYLIEGLAHAGLGEPFVVTRPEEASAAANRFCNYIKTPLLKDITLNIDGFEAYDIEPSVIPDMFSERPIVVTGKWKGNNVGRIRVTGTSGKGPYIQEFNMADQKPMAENEPLRYLWARTKIARLSDFQFGETTEANKEDVTSLGLKYSLLTKYTSFIAVHEQVRNPEGSAKDVTQPLPLPKGVSELAVGQSMANVPEPGLCLMIVLLSLGIYIARKNRLTGINE
ncbi:MAG: VIT and VWA domain-containing protein [Proteobacteria bacterium]|nr:VIT and VWA domain-containing protein [Pseudomonadota bacterium]